MRLWPGFSPSRFGLWIAATQRDHLGQGVWAPLFGMTKSPHEDPRGTRPSAAPGAIGDARAGSAFSIFHEPWWLDIATDRQWGEARVEQDGATLGRLPYPLGRFCGFPVSTTPSLIR